MGRERAKEVGARVRCQRLRAGITIREMGEKTGLGSEVIIKFEATGSLPLKHFAKIWEALGVEEPLPMWIDKLLK